VTTQLQFIIIIIIIIIITISNHLKHRTMPIQNDVSPVLSDNMSIVSERLVDARYRSQLLIADHHKEGIEAVKVIDRTYRKHESPFVPRLCIL